MGKEDKEDNKKSRGGTLLMSGIFAVVKDENGEEKEVDIRRIVGSKGKGNKD